MWKQVGESRKSSRLVMAGSIYMRKKSIQYAAIENSAPREIKNKISRIKNPSSGKIVKNTKKSLMSARNFDQISYTVSKQMPTSFSSTLKEPLTDKKNIITMEINQPKFEWFSKLQDPENEKIKEIQQKYRKMLQNYEKKKKEISSELQGLNKNKNEKKGKQKKNGIKKTNPVQENISPIKQAKVVEKKETQNLNDVSFNNEKQQSIRKRNYSVAIVQGINKAGTIKNKGKDKLVNRYPGFFSLIKGQMELEQTLRKLKYKAEGKYEEFKNILTEKGMQQEQVQKLIKLDFQETDPFFNEKQEQLTNQKLSELILKAKAKCDQNWNSYIQGSFSRWEIKQLFSQLNFQKKQQITLRAFVREVGFHLEKHYRNRDLFRVYERLKPFDEKTFIAVLIKENEKRRDE